MAAHLNENVKSHLSMVSEVSRQVPELQCMVEQQRKQIEALTSHVQALLASEMNSGTLTTLQAAPSPVFIPPPDFVMADFVKHKKDDDTWFSPTFYSHIRGYIQAMYQC